MDRTLTTELYGGDIGKPLDPREAPVGDVGGPPIPPSPVPVPVKVEVVNQPIPIKQRRMADEGPDGRIRDTSSEALRPGNDLGFRNLDAEQTSRPSDAPNNEPSPEVKPEAIPPQAAPEQGPPEPPKVYAGKFKSVDDLEQGYIEAQKLITRQGQEKAERERAALATPPAPVVKTPEQIAAEQAENNRILNDFVSNPKEYIEKNVVQRVTTALAAQQIAGDWRKNNPDISEHEVRVAFEATLLAQSDPVLARDPAALLNKATDNFRSFTGKIRSEGAKEALTQETRVIPLLSNTAPPLATEQPSPRAPQTQGEVTDSHVAWLQDQSKRSQRGLRR
jgi:hypothetical protein